MYFVWDYTNNVEYKFDRNYKSTTEFFDLINE